jgi:hypothetical protein
MVELVRTIEGGGTMKQRLGQMGMATWFLAGAATVLVTLALAGVAAATLGSPRTQLPPDTSSQSEILPPGVSPDGVVPTPPPTVYPPDIWGPKPVPTTTGPTMAGIEVDVDTNSIIQLPPNIYLKDHWTLLDCVMGWRCPRGRGVMLGVLDGESTIMVSGGHIWEPEIAPGEEGVFDWLYAELGVAKGSELRIEPVGNAK